MHMWSHPTHSTEIFPDAEDVNTVESARKSLIEARKLLHEIRKRLIDGIPYESRSYSPVRKKAQAWGSAQSNWTSALTSAKKKLKNATRRARHADNKSDVSTSIDKKGSASPHTVAERKVESSTAFNTSMERLALDEAEAMRSTEALPKPAQTKRNIKRTLSEQLLLDEAAMGSMSSLPPNETERSTSPLPDEKVIQKRNKIASA